MEYSRARRTLIHEEKKTEVENLVSFCIMYLVYIFLLVRKSQIREISPGDCKLQPWRTQDDTLGQLKSERFGQYGWSS